MDRKQIDLKMRELLKNNRFTLNTSRNTKRFVDKGDVFVRPVSEGVEMVVSQFGQLWDAWLWFNKKTVVCLKLNFLPDDFENDIIQQLFYNP